MSGGVRWLECMRQKVMGSECDRSSYNGYGGSQVLRVPRRVNFIAMLAVILSLKLEYLIIL